MTDRIKHRHSKFKVIARITAWFWTKKGRVVTIRPTTSVKSGWPVRTGYLVKGVMPNEHE